MKTPFKLLTVALALAGSSAFAASIPGNIGEAAPADAEVTRVITIKPDTKYVNVTQDEIVKFVDVATGKSFVWDFDTDNWASFDLDVVAPDVLASQHVEVYVNKSIYSYSD